MVQKIRRRDLIILTGLISLAGITVIAVGLLILQDAGHQEATETATESFPQSKTIIPYQETTGLRQYPLAQAHALTWAEDAALISADTNWSKVPSRKDVGVASEWSYYFYSPQKKRKYFVTVQPNGTVHGLEHVIPVEIPPLPLDTDSWSVDSPMALATWLDGGGGQMVGQNPGLEIVAQLRTIKGQPDPVWLIVGLNNQTNETFSILVDATQGRVLR